MLVVIRRVSLAAVAVASFVAAPSDAASLASHYSLDLGGASVAMAANATGGHASNGVMTTPSVAGGAIQKQLGVRYDAIKVSLGGSMGKGLVQWIQQTLAFNPTAPKIEGKSGAVVALTERFQPLTRMTFTNAYVSELEMPAVDVTTNVPAFITLSLTPQSTSAVDASTENVRAQANASPRSLWASRFKLVIAGLPSTAGARSVEAITIKQKVVEHVVGTAREYVKAGHVEMPNLVFTVSEKLATDIYAWHEDFVIKGNNAQDKEKNGSISYLAQDGTPLFTLDFHGLGIFKLTPDKAEAGSENIRRVKVEMYVEQIAFRPEIAGLL